MPTMAPDENPTFNPPAPFAYDGSVLVSFGNVKGSPWAIYYTLDGTNPTTSGTRIQYSGPFVLTTSVNGSPCTVSAYQTLFDVIESQIVTGVYTDVDTLGLDIDHDGDDPTTGSIIGSGLMTDITPGPDDD